VALKSKIKMMTQAEEELTFKNLWHVACGHWPIHGLNGRQDTGALMN
jgi:hypothetical protein